MATSTKTKQPKSRAKSSAKGAKSKLRKSPPKASGKGPKAGRPTPASKTGVQSMKGYEKKPQLKTRRPRTGTRDIVQDEPLYVMTTKQIENFLYRLAVDDAYWQALLNDPRGVCLAVGIGLPEDFELPVELPSRGQILELLETLAERLHDFGCAIWFFHLLFDPDSEIFDP